LAIIWLLTAAHRVSTLICRALSKLTRSAITLLLVPVFYSIAVLDLKIVKWEPGKH
jgi:hypothetical protein